MGTSSSNELTAAAGLLDALRLHWVEYLCEGLELGTFMLAACTFGTWLFYADSTLVGHLPAVWLRNVLMGLAMGLTAIAISVSPVGRRSGAHFNPAVSITFLYLGKMHWLDTLFYVVAQFLGGALGVLVARMVLGDPLASASVQYVVTVPGRYGIAAAVVAEVFMAFVLMTVVLRSANSRRHASYTPLYVGALVALYVIFLAPVSGFSVNPARTVASALFAGNWTALWIYVVCPVGGMLGAAAWFVTVSGDGAAHCAKIYHDRDSPCPFRCRFRQLIRPTLRAF